MGIGPSTKETTLHHFKDPLVDCLAADPDINFLGVVVVGTPQDNKMKHFVGNRTATWVKSMGCDGAIVSTDGWGNSDIDFANTLEEIGKRDVSVVGLKFIGKQAKFVVENDYTNFVLDFNKSERGIETEVVGENTIDSRDASKALAFIKLKMRKDKQI
ncbi:glycine/sarcosine/betaine reductase component B subunit [Vagococcus fluvialis]|uniref:D-proline reductase, 45 kDa subunit / D-proline reductase, 23 kDa subunit n=1 Tax=Vagococcus fluvialis bH819 TaxID=1255619 RepID=A0A1X6WM27_9ENTE|nr:D-proline reductase, 45 kDa subunit / D-proline reductase, 23 kDa subunit [Vagococcus fluvialis bH819]HCM89821.1 proline reductase [Vagococcus sp.]